MTTPDEVTAARAARRRAETQLVTGLGRLDRARRRLDRLRRQGVTGPEVDEAEVDVERLTRLVAGSRAGLQQAQLTLREKLVDFTDAASPANALAERSALNPIVLLPVRVETAFDPPGDGTPPTLLVRIYPDDIAVQSHEPALTDDEVDLARRFWIDVYRARTEAGQDGNGSRQRELGAWRTLSGEHGNSRAAWIARSLQPRTLDVASVDDLEFGVPDTTTESWSRAPRSAVMPDRFVVLGYAGSEPAFEVVGRQIPDPLFLGPAPHDEEPELGIVDGDVAAGPNLAWLLDFDEAVRAGMGVRVPLSEQQADTGFDRIVVVGLKLSAGPDDGADLLADLLSDHHYGPSGLSLIPQGTPTNNTGRLGSGYSSSDADDTDARYDREFGPPAYEPTGDDHARVDGQVLSDSIGVDAATLVPVRGATATDQREARAATDALWPATLGYYLRDLLEVSPAVERAMARFVGDNVTGRGPIPALRVGSQPYGVLATTDFTTWEAPGFTGSSDDPMVGPVSNLAGQARRLWEGELARVTHLGGAGDPHAVLLDVLSRHATSVEHHRRQAAGPDYRSNWAEFNVQSFGDRLLRALIASAAAGLAENLGATIGDDPALLFQLAFFNRADLLTDPVVQRPAGDGTEDRGADETWSEVDGLERIYHLDGVSDPVNYIGWLLRAPVIDVKAQRFFDAAGEPLQPPDALLYRWLRRAFLLAGHDVAVQLVERGFGDDLVTGSADAAGGLLAIAREYELVDITEQPTPTRWRLLELPIRSVDPEAPAGVSILEHLSTEAGLARPQASSLRRVRDGLSVLEDLPTARLERLFREHMDVCSYRLDAWISGLVGSRLDEMRSLGAPSSDNPARRFGIHLGAYGWLEDVRPRPAAETVPPEQLPRDLRPDDGTPVTRRPDNGGHIHAPSLNQGATAAVLRNAYLASAGRESPGIMAVDLSSQRVRTALSLLEGVGEGQPLGALLGHRFERSMTENTDVPGLARFLPAFRDAFPLVADAVTPDDDTDDTDGTNGADRKAGRHVVDGLALAEAGVLRQPPEPYPWGVAGLPAAATPAGRALEANVEALAGALDAVADLLLAEAVHQSVQGNHQRAGAVLASLGAGSTVQLPEVVSTPRSGTVVHHRVVVEFPMSATAWPGSTTPRAAAQPEVNAWLADRLPPPDRIRFLVEHRDQAGVPELADLSVFDLDVQPIDLVLMIGDDLHRPQADQSGSRDDTTTLESLIAYRLRRRLAEVGRPEPATVTVRFDDRDPTWDIDDVTVAELLPLLIAGRVVIVGPRPLSAVDLRPAGEANNDAADDPNPGGVDLVGLTTRVDGAITSLAAAAETLMLAVQDLVAAPTAARADAVRAALVAVATHGWPGAFPGSAVGAETGALTALADRAQTVLGLLADSLNRAADLRATVGTGTTPITADVSTLTDVCRLVLGAPMPVVPVFTAKNGDELANADDQDLVDVVTLEQWWLGLPPVRPAIDTVDRLALLSEAFGRSPIELGSRQLPVRNGTPWVAGPVDPETLADADHLHLTHVRSGAADPRDPTLGLVLDEWTETIPGTTETTGLAVHLHQPDSEPPQAILVAVPPRPRDNWRWEDLIGTINDTLDRAKLRAVEPDDLAGTALAHILPATLTAVATTPVATITMALIAAQDVAISEREEP